MGRQHLTASYFELVPDAALTYWFRRVKLKPPRRPRPRKVSRPFKNRIRIVIRVANVDT